MNYRSCWSLIYSSLFFHIRNKNRYILDTIHLILSPSPNLNSAVIAFFFFLMISSFLHFPLKESVRFRQLSRWSRNHSSLKVERCWPLPWRRKKNNNTIKKDKTSREKKIPWNPDSNDIVFRKKEEEPQTKLVGFDIAPGVCTLVASEPPNTTLSFFFSSLSLSTVQWFFFSYSIPLFYTGKRIKITKTKIGKFWSLRKLWRLLSVACNHPTQSGQWLPQAGVVYRRTWAVRFSYTDGAVREKGRRTFRCSAEKK